MVKVKSNKRSAISVGGQLFQFGDVGYISDQEYQIYYDSFDRLEDGEMASMPPPEYADFSAEIGAIIEEGAKKRGRPRKDGQ